MSGDMRFVVIKKRSLFSAIAALLAMALLFFGVSYSGAFAVFLNQPIRKVPIYRVARADKLVALSFDAAWGADKTEGIIKILKEYEADATFFLVGFWVDNYPEMTKKIAESGFEIGTHSNTHAHMARLSRQQCAQDLKQSMEKIESCTGVKPQLFRAPFGEYDNELIEAAESLGLMTIQWDVDSLDWMDKTTLEIAQRVLSRVKEGSIVLFHNNSDHILDALPLVLERLKMRGFKCVKVGDLIYRENYVIDSRGEQRLKSA
jgi:polysaccharide deacetylase family sporulation protein PdaB